MTENLIMAALATIVTIIDYMRHFLNYPSSLKLISQPTEKAYIYNEWIEVIERRGKNNGKSEIIIK